MVCGCAFIEQNLIWYHAIVDDPRWSTCMKTEIKKTLLVGLFIFPIVCNRYQLNKIRICKAKKNNTTTTK